MITAIAADAPTTTVGNPVLNIVIFAAFVALTLIIVLRASRNNKTASDYYAAGRSFMHSGSTKVHCRGVPV